MLVPLKIQPGVYRNGTEYQAKGRWYDAALVRWRGGGMGPVGGWEKWSQTPITGIARGIQPWRTNSGGRWLAVGTAAKLYVYSDAGTLYDITPSGFVAGDVDATINIGYGMGSYGTGLYGSARPDLGLWTPAATWSLDTWGEYLVGCMDADGKLYEWTLVTATPAQPIANAPIDNKGLIVTSERFLFALGAGGNPRKVQWSGQENNTVWAPSATNQAGGIELQTRGQIVCARRIRGETLILTTTDAHTATYVGPPYVYGFTKVGEGCGIVAPNAIAMVDNQAAWLGERGFFTYDGYVKRLESEVIDYFLANASRGQMSKTFAFHNSQFDEIWWIYPDDATDECCCYLAWNYVENHWSIGPLLRSAAADRVVFDRPLLVGLDGYVYEHETGVDHDTETVYAETGPLELEAGERLISVNYLYPDESTLGAVEATFKGRMYPTAAEVEYGPYSMANPTPVRLTARQVRVRFEETSPADWRLGTTRVEVVPGGKR